MALLLTNLIIQLIIRLSNKSEQTKIRHERVLVELIISRKAEMATVSKTTPP